MILNDLLKNVYWSADEDAAGATATEDEYVVDDIDTENPDDTVVVEDEQADAGADEYDYDTVAAKYREQLKQLGAVFDNDGNFVGWQPNYSYQQMSATSPPADYSDDIETRLTNMIKPIAIDATVRKIADEHPKLAKYSKQVLAMLRAYPTYPTDENSILGLFYLARGMAADLEIAEVAKKLKKSSRADAERIDAGANAVSAGLPRRDTGAPRHAKITPEIEKKAKVWGIDPQKLADEFAKVKQRKGESYG